MPIDPDAQNLLAMLKAAGRPPLHTLSPPEARTAYLAGRALLQPDLPEVAEARDLAAPGAHGPIPLRLYRGKDLAAGPAPTLIDRCQMEEPPLRPG